MARTPSTAAPPPSTLLVGTGDLLASIEAMLARRTHVITRAGRVEPTLAGVAFALPTGIRFDLIVVGPGEGPAHAALLCQRLRAVVPRALIAAAGPPLEDDALAAILDAGADTYIVAPREAVDGSMLATQLAVVDRTARDRALAARAKPAPDPFRQLTKMISDYCFSIRVGDDGELMPQWVTGGFTKVTGYAPTELDGELGSRLVHPIDGVIGRAWLARLAAGEPSEAEYRILHKSGETRWLRVWGQPLRNADGRVAELLCAVRDITARVHAREALRDERAALQAIIQHAPLAIISVDYAGNVTKWNPAAERLFGWSADEVVGKPNPIVPAERWADYQLIIENAFCGEAESGDEVERLRKDGTVIPVNVARAVLRDADGAPTGIVGMLADIADRKRLEAELRLADRLASVGRLAASVGHEVNNPLAYVLTNVDLVLDDLTKLKTAFAAGSLTPRRIPVGGTEARRPTAPEAIAHLEAAVELLREAREGAERVRHIVRDLKVFSASEGEKKAPVDPRRVLDSCANMAGAEIRHRARLVKRYESTPCVLAHEARLGQVLLNLLINAAHSIPEDGDVEQHEIGVATFLGDDGRVVIEVRDTGVGIPPDVLARIFEPFFTTKTGGRGMGLGLSICHRIVTDLGGEIVVESEVGQGTCFRVVLPAAPAEASEPGEAKDVQLDLEPAPALRPRLLIVDDELQVARAIARLFRDHDVVVTESGRAAIEAILEGPAFDAILCDLMMPDLTGMDVYERVCAERPGVEHRMAFMTGGVFTPRATAFLAGVPNARLDKPFEAATVVELVNELSRKRR